MQKTIHGEQSRTILSGVKPTGRPHLGNYFGAMRQFVNLQAENGEGINYFFVADYHALNLIQNAEEMRQLSLDVVIDFLAIGLDPSKSIIFKQSDIPEHTELAWIFDTITTVPYLKRAHAYKDAVAKGGEEDVSAGTFTYPMLMAADILLYDTDFVPVGQDQKQHIEFARDTAEKFNRLFCNPDVKYMTEAILDQPAPGHHRTLEYKGIEPVFKLPEAYILENVQTVPGIDGQKMSKSYNNTISLFAEDSEIEEKVMAIVTDSSGERPENVFAIHKLIKPENELQKIYEADKGKYKALKEILISDLKDFIRPLRERREEIASNLDYVKKVLGEGKERASEKAREKMKIVKQVIGVI